LQRASDSVHNTLLLLKSPHLFFVCTVEWSKIEQNLAKFSQI
jgi:hypothetical protein